MTYAVSQAVWAHHMTDIPLSQIFSLDCFCIENLGTQTSVFSHQKMVFLVTQQVTCAFKIFEDWANIFKGRLQLQVNPSDEKTKNQGHKAINTTCLSTVLLLRLGLKFSF